MEPGLLIFLGTGTVNCPPPVTRLHIEASQAKHLVPRIVAPIIKSVAIWKPDRKDKGVESVKLVIGADHAGFELKESMRIELVALGHELFDIGAYEYLKDDDYPDYAAAVGRAIASGEGDRGILICGSGVGACIAANKIQGARACLCHDIYSAAQGVEHDDMNILCLGGQIIGKALASKLIAGFLDARFIDEGRYRRRLNKTIALERQDDAGD